LIITRPVERLHHQRRPAFGAGFPDAGLRLRLRHQERKRSNLQTHFANDDYYTDADSNAYQLANFISNHDIGRFGGFIRNELGGAPNANGWPGQN
jgi:hypothetical protein